MDVGTGCLTAFNISFNHNSFGNIARHLSNYGRSSSSFYFDMWWVFMSFPHTQKLPQKIDMIACWSFVSSSFLIHLIFNWNGASHRHTQIKNWTNRQKIERKSSALENWYLLEEWRREKEDLLKWFLLDKFET